MSLAASRRGIATGDALLVLSVLALVFALAYPRLERVAMRERADAIAYSANTVLDAARRFRVERGDWPRGADLGAVPEDMASYLPPDFSFENRGYLLKWDRWERVEAPTPDPAPPSAIPELSDNVPPPEVAPDSVEVARPTLLSLGGVTVRCDDPRVLAVLLERFGHARSFVRGDAWTLVVPPGREGQ